MIFLENSISEVCHFDLTVKIHHINDAKTVVVRVKLNNLCIFNYLTWIFIRIDQLKS